MSRLRIEAVTSLPSMRTRPASSNSTGFSRASAAELVAPGRAPGRDGARARSARDTSRRCRGSGSRAAPRAAGRPCSCRPLRARRWRRSSGSGRSQRVEKVEEAGEAYRRRLGALDLDAFSRDEAGDRAEHRDPVVAVRVDRAARGSARDAADHEAVGVARMCAPRRAAPSVTVSIRSVSFARSSAAPRTTLSPRAIHGERARRAAARRRAAAPRRRRSSCAASSAGLMSRSATGSPPTAAG